MWNPVFVKKGIMALSGAFMLASTGMATPALAQDMEADVVTADQAEDPWTPEKVAHFIQDIKEQGRDKLYDNLYELRRITGYHTNEELTRAAIDALPVLLEDEDNWQLVMQHYSNIGESNAEDRYDEQIYNVLKEPVREYLEQTIGMQGGDELRNRLYNVHVVASSNRALSEMFIDFLPELFSATDLDGWLQIVERYEVYNTNYQFGLEREPEKAEHINFTDEIYEALQPQMDSLQAYIDNIDQYDGQQETNVLMQVIFLAGRLGEASPRHAPEAVDLAGPFLTHEDERVRQLSIDAITRAAGGYELASPDDLSALTKAADYLAPLVDDTSSLTQEQITYIVYVISDGGEKYETLAERALDLLEKVATQNPSLAEHRYGNALRNIAGIAKAQPAYTEKAADILYSMKDSTPQQAYDAAYAFNRLLGHDDSYMPQALEMTQNLLDEESGEFAGAAARLLADTGYEYQDAAPQVMQIFNEEACIEGEALLTRLELDDGLFYIAAKTPEIVDQAIETLQCDFANALEMDNKDRYFWDSIRSTATTIVDLHELKERHEQQTAPAPQP